MFYVKNEDQGTIVLPQQDYLPILVESFLVDRRAQGLSPETISFYRKKLRYIQDYCEAQAVTQISQIKPDLIRRYILKLSETHKPGGVHACFRSLRTLLLWVELEEIMPGHWPNPVRRVKVLLWKQQASELPSSYYLQAALAAVPALPASIGHRWNQCSGSQTGELKGSGTPLLCSQAKPM